MKVRLVSQTVPIPHRQAGFALIAALLLVFLIVGLLVTLVSLTTVEMRVVDNAAKLRQARNNALSGLHQAIDALQRNAGTDQSITATAGLLDTDPATSKIDGVANPWLTGIWSNQDTQLPHHPGSPLIWLISGAQEKTEEPPLTPFSKLDDPSPTNANIWLLRKVVGDNDALSVKARKIAVTAKNPTRSSEPGKTYTVGHYAWWASDEGVKCRVNLPLAETGAMSNTEAVTLAKWKLSAPRRAPWKMEDMTALPMDSPDLSKVLTFAQIPLLGAPNQRTKLITSLEKHFHDVTADSNGVISDCKSGGLKTDLSLAFEMTDDEFAKTSDLSTDDESLMPSMRDYYRTYKRVKNPQTDPGLAAQPFTIKPENDSSEATAAAANAYLHSENALPVKMGFTPIILRMEYAYSLLSKNKPAREEGASDQKLLLVLDPIITLWNPYNIKLEFDAYRVTSWIPSAHFVVEKRDPWMVQRSYIAGDEVWHQKQLYRANSPKKGESPPGKNKEWEKLVRKWTLATDITLQKVFENHGASGGSGFVMLQNPKKLTSTIVLNPGEIVVFSHPGNQLYTQQTGEFQLHLERGLNTQGGIAFDRLTAMHPGKIDAEESLLPLYSESEIRVSLEPLRDGDYEKEDPFNFIANYAKNGLDGTPTAISFQRYGESLGYFNRDERSIEAIIWADARSGDAPHFTYSTRAYGGKDKSGKPLPGLSDTLKIGKQVLETEKRFFGLIDWHLKTEADANKFPVQMIARFDPRSVFLHLPRQGYPCTVPTYQLSARKLTSSTGIIELNGEHGYWGPSNSASGEHYAPLFEIPTVPMISLGQLQHYQGGVSGRLRTLNPGYVIGNSWAHPYVARDKLEENYGAEVIKDLSYQSNDKLFDHFYFSSIVPRQDEETIKGRLIDFTAAANPKSLPNPRMRLYLAPGQTAKTLRVRLTEIPTPASTPPYQKVAANLLVEGAFNVNSTSVEAWKALLASLDGNEIPVRDSLDVTTVLIKSKGAPLSRFTLPNGDNTERWRGFRTLSDKQLQALAEAIVREVKTRGPFSSLSDFVNRRLKKDSSGLCGTLQAAINRTNINQDFTALVTEQQLLEAAQMGHESGGADWSFPYPEHCTGPIGAGAAGFLTQGDLLQALAPHLTARSDTFKVRAYGDVVHPITGKLEARAWCEAIVQRLPDYINTLKSEDEKPEPAWTPLADLKLDSNRSLGRRFRIVRIRWLSPDEV
ncbi:hypothetical protein BH11VER1_BH11VER1_18000 [soil metagenome]